jgi:hypothetical protein
VICAYEYCQKEFEPKTHNQKYCSDECCRIATNEKLRQAYYDKKDRLAGKPRKCKTQGCNVMLSMYNEGKICDKCINEKKEKERKSIVDMVKNVIS